MDTQSVAPLALVVSRLDQRGLRLPDHQYACPACLASSFSIHTRADGRVQLRCQYACPIDAIVRALDLALSDLFSNPVKGRGIGIGIGRGSSEETVSYKPVPFTGEDSARAQPELVDLLERYRLGELAPRPVRLGRMPADASADMCRVALDLELLIGLRAAAFEDRPLPYSTTLCAQRLGWGSNYARASRALRKLVSIGVIECVGSMRPRPGVRFGTKLYAPPAEVAADTGERPALRDVNRARKAS